MAAHQCPPSLGFSSQEHWSGLTFPSPMHESEKWKWSRSVVSDSERPHTAAPQAPPSMGFSRQKYWSMLPLPSPKWTGMGEFNSDDHYIYYRRQESLRRNGIAIMVNRVQNAVIGCNLKNDRMISVRFQGKPFNITVIQVYAPSCNTEEAEVERF